MAESEGELREFLDEPVLHFRIIEEFEAGIEYHLQRNTRMLEVWARFCANLKDEKTESLLPRIEWHAT